MKKGLPSVRAAMIAVRSAGRSPPPSRPPARAELSFAIKDLKTIFRVSKLVEAAKAEVLVPGWSAHFRIEKWDDTQDVPYRVRHGELALFEGLIRRDPRDKDVIVVANMSCNSSRTTGLRPEILEQLGWRLHRVWSPALEITRWLSIFMARSISSTRMP